MTTAYYDSSSQSDLHPELAQSIMTANHWNRRYDMGLDDTAYASSPDYVPSTPWRAERAHIEQGSTFVSDISPGHSAALSGEDEDEVSAESLRSFHTTYEDRERDEEDEASFEDSLSYHTTAEGGDDAHGARPPPSAVSSDDEYEEEDEDEDGHLVQDTKARNGDSGTSFDAYAENEEDDPKAKMRAVYTPADLPFDDPFHRDPYVAGLTGEDGTFYDDTDFMPDQPPTEYDASAQPTSAFTGTPMATYEPADPVDPPRIWDNASRRDVTMGQTHGIPNIAESESARISQATEDTDDYHDGTDTAESGAPATGAMAHTAAASDSSIVGIMKQHAPSLFTSDSGDEEEYEYDRPMSHYSDSSSLDRQRAAALAAQTQTAATASIERKKTWADRKSEARSAYANFRTRLSVAGSFFGLDKSRDYSRFDTTAYTGMATGMRDGILDRYRRTRQTLGTYMSTAVSRYGPTGRSRGTRLGWRVF